MERPVSAEQNRYPARLAGPPIPEDIEPSMLAPEARGELRSLSKHTAEIVAKHLVAAGRLVDENPELALEHARAARARGARIAAVREATGIAAYHAGEWTEALAELRTARRITGDSGHLAVMADCERALGRPERALRLAQSDEAAELDPAAKIELSIVVAGARRDLGENSAALVELQGAGLDRDSVQPWSARLWYAYADALLAADRRDEAVEWFLAVAGIDDEGATNVDDRLVELGVIESIEEEGDESEDSELSDEVDEGSAGEVIEDLGDEEGMSFDEQVEAEVAELLGEDGDEPAAADQSVEEGGAADDEAAASVAADEAPAAADEALTAAEPAPAADEAPAAEGPAGLFRAAPGPADPAEGDRPAPGQVPGIADLFREPSVDQPDSVAPRTDETED